jgi:hypothetical protein
LHYGGDGLLEEIETTKETTKTTKTTDFCTRIKSKIALAVNQEQKRPTYLEEYEIYFVYLQIVRAKKVNLYKTA